MLHVKHLQRTDVIIVGAGHAGCEAALAAARRGASVRLITQDLDTIAKMSCNPAIGGIGKSHLVHEIDAMGGAMGRMADLSALQYRLLNRRKGPAVRATRTQCDRRLYHIHMRQILDAQPNLHLHQGTIRELMFDGDRVIGVVDELDIAHEAAAVILTTGTFLEGLIHVGEKQFSAGRAANAAVHGLSAELYRKELKLGRLKTGTPPRLDKRSIDWDSLPRQAGETDLLPFSRLHQKITQNQIPCAISRTNQRTHDIIMENLARSPMYSGTIESTGPRYCPSIEDKIHRFASKDSHQVFLEPEGRDHAEVYPNGISTSLPIDVQWAFVRSMEGLENAIIIRPGYAIEYDYVDPTELKATLECKKVSALFHAGQINGTTGYEEAAAQGLIAGINAAAHALDLESWVPSRSEAYIGVMLDDLVNKGITEPYRMFTSRAEFRLRLREDNADVRLSEHAIRMGMLSPEQQRHFEQRQHTLSHFEAQIKSCRIGCGKQWKERLDEHQLPMPKQDMLFSPYSHRQDVDSKEAMRLFAGFEDLNPFDQQSLMAFVHYDGYLEKQDQEIKSFQRLESQKIPNDFDYTQVGGLSIEAHQRLVEHRPLSLGQASRLSGITPAAITALSMFLRTKKT
ncbi:MAG: tRNA uridine-5-carboxymethylaminomethyl(34) synthesis enzyme MnmG [Mariprofundaceae bacterium]|nr:tRNA uridine-5-carboxymethylaminomethyl(34) synthesis enzyme MnmG [Mariprofundaceae bacterium]